MNKYIKNVLAGSMAALSLTACSSDFLETTPTESVGAATTMGSIDNVKAAINGMAYIMCSQHGAWGQGYCGENRIKSLYGEFISQEFRYNQYASGYSILMNGNYYDVPDKAYCNYPWAYYYEIIGNANSIICNVDNSDGTEAEKQFYKAQALTFRAYCYEKLMELYTYRWQDTDNGATDGVVLRIDESTGSMPLSTVAECYAQIYKDLDEAIAGFKASGMKRGEGEVWLTNINTAYAVYARAALNKQDYATALSNAKLAQNGYALMSPSDYAAGFCKPTSEWIFGSYADATENNWYYTFGTQYACNGYYTRKYEDGAGDIEKELTDRMPTTDIRMACFLTADKFEGMDLYNGTGTEAQKDGSVKEGVAHMDTEYGYMTSDEAIAVAKAYCDSRTPSGLDKPYTTGYYYLGAQLKFWVFDSPGVSYLCHIRSSEMVLIEAEANYFLGDEAAAIDALVRLNKDSGRDPEYSCTKSGDDLFEEIVDYRELELWGEGFNWYDVKRWNRDIVRKSFADGGNCHTTTATTVKADSSTWTWSIPETETDYNSEVN
jgi:hypothetical protein